MRDRSYPPSSLAFDWTMAVLAVLLMAGIIQDGWAHGHGLVDQSFLTPWHAIMYACMLMSGIGLGIVGLRNLSLGYRFRHGLPSGYWTSLIGVIVFLTGGIFDLLWHTLFGIEGADISALVSPSHLWLALGAALVFVGPIRSIAYRYDEKAGGWAVTGPAVLAAAALLTLLAFFTQYASLLADFTPEQIMTADTADLTGPELFSIRADGSYQTRLITLAKHGMYDAATSPDGRFIACRLQASTRSGGLPPSDIYIANAAGSAAVRIMHSGRHDAQPAWSPDGRRLAYVSMPAQTSGKFQILTVNREGTDGHVIVNGSTTVQSPSWSPDGTSIVFQSRNGLNQQLAVVPASGGPVRWLSSTIGGAEPFWSRSGLILFRNAAGTLMTTDANGSVATSLNVRGAQPAFSPNGKQIAYVSSAGGADQIFIASAEGAHPRNVTKLAAQDASHPAWRSNGELIFTAAGRPKPTYGNFARARSMDEIIISSLLMMGLVLMLVRRWRMPLGAITVLLAYYSIALATQKDTYWDVPAAIITGIVADSMLAVLRSRARIANGFYTFAFIVPFVMSAGYIACVRLHDGLLAWPPHMILGAPFIAGFVGLLVSFCFISPVACGSPSTSGVPTTVGSVHG